MGADVEQIETVAAVLEEVVPVGGVGIQSAKDFDQGIRLCVVGDGDLGDRLIGKPVYDTKRAPREAGTLVPDRAEGRCAELGADATSRLAKAQIRDIVLFEEEQVFVDDLPVVFDEWAVFGYPFEKLEPYVAREFLCCAKNGYPSGSLDTTHSVSAVQRITKHGLPLACPQYIGQPPVYRRSGGPGVRKRQLVQKYTHRAVRTTPKA